MVEYPDLIHQLILIKRIRPLWDQRVEVKVSALSVITLAWFFLSDSSWLIKWTYRLYCELRSALRRSLENVFNLWSIASLNIVLSRNSSIELVLELFYAAIEVVVHESCGNVAHLRIRADRCRTMICQFSSNVIDLSARLSSLWWNLFLALLSVVHLLVVVFIDQVFVFILRRIQDVFSEFL